jgi:cytochrome c oxidase subunit 3
MTVTVVLGIIFLIFQGIDYTLLGSEGLTLSSGTYGTTYYTLTGFHGAHVFGGVIMLSVVLYRGMAGQFSGKHYDAVEAASLYWHFVDVVWILLFSLLYLLPGKTPTT